MIVGRHQNTTRVLGKPPAWDETKQGVCPGLPISDIVTPVGPAMESVWHPTPGELERLAAGAPVVLAVLGRNHPPVSLIVGEPVDI